MKTRNKRKRENDPDNQPQSLKMAKHDFPVPTRETETLDASKYFVDEIISIRSQFNDIYRTNACKMELNDLKSVEFYLSKCDFSFNWTVRDCKWHGRAERHQLLNVEQFEVVEAETQIEACNKLISNLSQNIDDLTSSVLPAWLPSLIAFKSAFDASDCKTDSIGKIISASESSGLACGIKCSRYLRGRISCEIELDGNGVCEGFGTTRQDARHEAAKRFANALDDLIARAKNVNNNAMMEVAPVVRMCASEFVLFELPGCEVGNKAGKILNYSAQLNCVSLKFRVNRGICSFFVGPDLIAAVRNDGNEGEGLRRLTKLGYEKLKRRCHTVVIKIMHPDVNVRRSDVLTRAGSELEELDISLVEAELGKTSTSFKIQSFVFSSEFSEKERESISSCALLLGFEVMKCHPILTVKRKVDVVSLVKFLIENGGSTKNYELISPIGFQHSE